MRTASKVMQVAELNELPFAELDIEIADHLSGRLSRAKHQGEMERNQQFDKFVQSVLSSLDKMESELEAAASASLSDDDDQTIAQSSAEEVEEPIGDGLILYDVRQVVKQLNTQMIDSCNGLERDLQRLAKPSAAYFVYVTANSESIRQLNNVLDQFPNFRVATEAVIGAAKLSLQSDTPLRLPTFLLDGPPGIGKTEWIRAIAKATQLPLIVLPMGSLHGRFELAGGHRSYKGAEAGLLIKRLLKAGVANPLFLFDEAELADPDLYQPLYQFIEDDYFTDHFLEIDFRVSHVNVFMITNDRALLPAAIRSRACELLIEEPSAAERAAIITRIYDRLRTTHVEYQSFPTTLDPACLDRLQRLSLRQVRISLEMAMLRSTATVVDVESPIVNPAFILDAPKGHPIGFVH